MKYWYSLLMKEKIFNTKPAHQKYIRLSCLLLKLILAIFVFVYILTPSIGISQVITNIQADTSLQVNSEVTQVGDVFDITKGTRPNNPNGTAGGNLFHSFTEFTIGEGKTVNFSNDSGLSTTNILSRVTGNNSSGIDGAIKTTGFGDANLFLLNPNGIIFGENATLDISGSFHASTADYLVIGGEQFTLDSDASAFTFSSADISAFGFSSNPQPISIENSFLEVATNKTLSLVAGNDSLETNNLPGISVKNGQLMAEGGRINIVSIASAGEVTVDASLFTVESIEPLGNISLVRTGPKIFDGLPITDLLTGGGGNIFIRGGKLTIDNVNINSKTESVSPPLNIGIDISGESIMFLNDANIDTSTSGSSNAGHIILSATDTISITDNVTLSSAVETDNTTGSGGNIRINSPTFLMSGNGGINTTTVFEVNGPPVPTNLGKGGNVEITATQMTMSEDSRIVSSSTGSGNAGNVTLDIRGNTTLVTDGILTLSDQTFIEANTQDIGRPGKAGDISILADQTNLVGGNLSALTEGLGSGGDIMISSNTVNASNQSQVITDTQGTGNAGNITFNVAKLTSSPGVTISSSSGTIDTGASENSGAAGTITIQGVQTAADGTEAATEVSLTGTTLSTTLNGEGRGSDGNDPDIEGDSPLQPGNITITANDVFLNNGTNITSDTNGTGNAGEITFNVDALKSNQGLSTNSFGSVEISSASTAENTGIGVGGGEAGNPGTVTIQGIVADGSPVQNKIELARTIIKTEAVDEGEDGEISLSANEDINLRDTTISTDVEFGTAISDEETLSSITISTPQTLTLTGGSITARASGPFARAGNITLEVGNLKTQKSQIPVPVNTTETTGVLISSSLLNSPEMTDVGSILIRGGEKIEDRIGDDPVITELPSNSIELSDTQISTAFEMPGGDQDTSTGGIRIVGKDVSLTRSTLSTITEAAISAPNIHLIVENLKVSQSTISTNSGEDLGKAGDVTITAFSPIERLSPSMVLEDTQISTESEGSGNGGAIRLESDGQISLARSSLSANVTDAAFETPRSEGNISITTPDLQATDSSVTAQTTATRNAGNITLSVDQLKANSLQLSSSSNGLDIETQNVATGAAGNIFIQGTDSEPDNFESNIPPVRTPSQNTIELTNASITTEALGKISEDAVDEGNGGNIIFSAIGDITLRDTSISANVVDTAAENTEGARIVLNTENTLSIIGGQITAETRGNRVAGDVVLLADNILTQSTQTTVNSTPEGQQTGLLVSSSSTSTSTGAPGGIFLQGPVVDAFSENLILGGIDANRSSRINLQDSTFRTTADGDGTGALSIDDDGISSTGQIGFSAQDTVLMNTALEATTSSPTPGGIIELVGENFTLQSSSALTSSTGEGVPGVIFVGQAISQPVLSVTLKDSTISANAGDAVNPNDEIDVRREFFDSTILLNTPRLDIDNSTIEATTNGAFSENDIKFRFLADLNVRNSEISTESTGIGKAGSISFDCSTSCSFIFDDSTVRAAASTTGEAGTIDLFTDEGTIQLTNSNLSASVNDVPPGSEVDTFEAISLTTPELIINGGTLSAETTGDRNAGKITIRTAALSINTNPTTASPVQISSSSTGEGNAGEVNINNDIDLFPFDIERIPENAPTTISEATIATEARATGDGGSIDIRVNGPLSFTNTILSANVNDGTDPPDGESTGSITVTAPALTIEGGGITAQSTGDRAAGDVVLKVGSITTDGGTEISSSSVGATTTGAAGSVSIEGPDSTQENPTPVPGAIQLAQTEVSTTSEGVGESGSIALAAFEGITLTDTIISGDVNNAASSEDTEGASIELRTSDLQITGGEITAQTIGSRDAGDVELKVASITTDGGTEISSSSVGATTTGAAGSVSIEGPDSTQENPTPVPGAIQLAQTEVSTTSEGVGESGSIALAAFEGITLTDTIISGDVNNAASSEDTEGASIELRTSDLQITGGEITAQTIGSRDAGDVELKVASITTDGGTEISSSSVGATTTGAAGSVSIEGPDSTQENPTPVPGAIQLTQTEVSTTSEGVGESGSIALAAFEGITLTDTIISGDVNNAASSEDTEGASIELRTSDLQITGGEITAQTIGSRDAGDVELKVASITTDGGTEISSSSVGATTTGAAGSVSIEGPDSTQENPTPVPGAIQLTQTEVSTTSEGVGESGSIALLSETGITLADTTISANVANKPNDTTTGSSDILLTAPALLINGGGITARSTGTRNAGNITLNTDQLTTSATGTTRVEISSSSTSDNSDAGNAGSITIEGLNSPVSGPILLTNTDITTEATSGRGGSILVDGAEKTVLDSTTVSATVTAGGQGGDITIHGSQMNPRNPNFGNEQLLVRNGSTITAESKGAGNAGTINLATAGTLRVTDSNVTTEATRASGGNIKLNADFMIHILDSRIESSVEGDATTEGGNISIDPEFVLIQNSQILARANQGAGGNIDLIGDVVLIDGLSTIDASSAFGVSGTVNITSPIQNLSGTIAPLPETIIQTATLYGQRCAAQKGSDFSSLNVRGRDRVPFEPGDYLLTPLILDTPGENLSKQASPSSSPMVSRLGLAALDTQLTGIFTSFDQGVIPLGLFEGGCRS